MSTTTTTPEVTVTRKISATRTGREIATLVVDIPGVKTFELGGKRAFRSNAVIVCEFGVYDHGQRDPENPNRALRTGWDWGHCGTRSSVADAQREADRLRNGSGSHFRQIFVVLVDEQ